MMVGKEKAPGALDQLDSVQVNYIGCRSLGNKVVEGACNRIRSRNEYTSH